MKFTKCEDCYLSENGGYKVVQYGGEWYAYFKPKGWKAFGNPCERSPCGSGCYLTAEDAQEELTRQMED